MEAQGEINCRTVSEWQFDLGRIERLLTVSLYPSSFVFLPPWLVRKDCAGHTPSHQVWLQAIICPNTRQVCGVQSEPRLSGKMFTIPRVFHRSQWERANRKKPQQPNVTYFYSHKQGGEDERVPLAKWYMEKKTGLFNYGNNWSHIWSWDFLQQVCVLVFCTHHLVRVH